MQVWVESNRLLGKNIESNFFPSVEAMLANCRHETAICCLRQERIKNNARLIKTDGLIGKGSKAFTIFGPTCDSNDQLPQAVSLPDNVCEGDWIEFSLLGAYSNALSTNFNAFGPRRFVNI